jgi:hypothetical protein
MKVSLDRFKQVIRDSVLVAPDLLMPVGVLGDRQREYFHSGIAFSSAGACLHAELLCSRSAESIPRRGLSGFFLAPWKLEASRGEV